MEIFKCNLLYLSLKKPKIQKKKTLEIFKIQCGNDYWVKTTCRPCIYLETFPIFVLQSRNPNGEKSIWRKIQNSTKHAWGFENIALVFLFIKNCLREKKNKMAA